MFPRSARWVVKYVYMKSVNEIELLDFDKFFVGGKNSHPSAAPFCTYYCFSILRPPYCICLAAWQAKSVRQLSIIMYLREKKNNIKETADMLMAFIQHTKMHCGRTKSIISIQSMDQILTIMCNFMVRYEYFNLALSNVPSKSSLVVCCLVLVCLT